MRRTHCPRTEIVATTSPDELDRADRHHLMQCGNCMDAAIAGRALAEIAHRRSGGALPDPTILWAKHRIALRLSRRAQEGARRAQRFRIADTIGWLAGLTAAGALLLRLIPPNPLGSGSVTRLVEVVASLPADPARALAASAVLSLLLLLGSWLLLRRADRMA